jgi:hypothetical protein
MCLILAAALGSTRESKEKDERTTCKGWVGWVIVQSAGVGKVERKSQS